ncbi:MAG TPA: hypothetical protein PLD32_13260 [Saprospiraceae bacterium]|nr:hypothetical protein [Saprospiraceae bacterium]HNG70275.1 hypothetical protein [Saprospiraceae bacterium]
MSINDIHNGQHFWALLDNQLAVFIKTKGRIYICGPWENKVKPEELKFISIIDKPQGHENIVDYYDEEE